MVRCRCLGSGSRDEFGLDNLSFTPSCLTCPDLSTAPNNVTISSESVCIDCIQSGGVITPAIDNCPDGSTLQYSIDGGTTLEFYSSTYDQDGPSQSIITRCLCDIDENVFSPSSSPVATNPERVLHLVFSHLK